MCKVLDNALPVLGGIAGGVIGSVVPGVGTALGAGIGAGLGGAAGNYAQTHNFGSALTSGALSGGLSYVGGSLSQGLGGIGATGADGASSGFQGAFTGAAQPDALAPELSGLGSSSADGFAGLGNSASSLGSLESGLGGSALFGNNAGMGLSGLDSGLSSGLGTADASTLASSGLQGGNYTGSLGGGSGSLGQTGATTAGQPQSPDLSTAVSQNPTNMGSGAVSSEGAQSTSMASNPSLMAAQGIDPSQSEGLGSLYGPNSTAGQSPMGSAISNSAPQSNVAFNAGNLGQQTMDNSSFDWGSPQNLSTMFRLANTGLGAYQQHMQQAHANDYINQINSMYSPNSPYAQQMSQELARKDAAAGRNSQYGNRAVQLAAALTQGRAQALGGNNYYNASQNNSGASLLNGLFSNFATPQAMQGLSNMGQAGYQGLQGLFAY